jgi:nucleoid DNA-binding protein
MSEFGLALFRLVLRELEQGGRVSVPTFGSFHTSVLRARKLHDMKSGVEIHYDKRVIRFRAAPSAKKTVNKTFRKNLTAKPASGEVDFGIVKAAPQKTIRR